MKNSPPIHYNKVGSLEACLSMKMPLAVIQVFCALTWVGLFCVPNLWVQIFALLFAVGYLGYCTYHRLWVKRPLSWRLWFRLQSIFVHTVLSTTSKGLLSLLSFIMLIYGITLSLTLWGLIIALAYLLLIFDAPTHLPQISALPFFLTVLAMSIATWLYKSLMVSWAKILFRRAMVQNYPTEELEALVSEVEDLRSQKSALMLKKHLNQAISPSQKTTTHTIRI